MDYLGFRIVRAKGSGSQFDNIGKLDDSGHSILGGHSQLLLRRSRTGHQCFRVFHQSLGRLQDILAMIGERFVFVLSVQSAGRGKQDGCVQIADDTRHCAGGVDTGLSSAGAGLQSGQNLRRLE